MIFVSELVKALLKFPSAAMVDPPYILRIASADDDLVGRIITHGQDAPEPTEVDNCEFEGWGDPPDPTAGDRIRSFLTRNPDKAHDIAFAALAGLYLSEDDDDTALRESESYPRCDGSEYVDIVGRAVEAAGMQPLIEELQEEAEAKYDEDEEE